MKKFLAMIGKKNIIIISGVILIGIAIYLNLTLDFGDAYEYDGDEYIMENSFPFDYDYDEYENLDIYDADDSRLGQATLVDNLRHHIDNNINNIDIMGVDNPEAVLDDVDRDNYFAVSVVNRQRARDQELELLSIIVESAETESMSDVKNKALGDMAAIALDIENEANIETLIKAKGFAECVAVVSGENANVIVKTDGLMPNEVAQIKEIVYEQAGILPKNVKIIEKT